MELTLDQALQKGIEAHKAGQIQEADRLYTAILKTRPKHSDANHNMGVLFVGVGKLQEALPFFKTALEAKPSTGQFWLSYIDALIKLDRIAEAQAVLDQAKDKGAKGESFDQLEKRLFESTVKKATAALKNDKVSSTKINILDSIKIDSALRLAKKNIQNGLEEEAIIIYDNILEKFPKNRKAIYGKKVLFDLANNVSSINKDPPQHLLQPVIDLYKNNQMNIVISKCGDLLVNFPHSTFLHNVLGAALHAAGKLDEATRCYKQALTLAPDSSDAHNNLGSVLQEQGQLPAAIESFKTAIEINPEFFEAVSNMANALKDKGDTLTAIENYRKALKIDPESPVGNYNLAVILQEFNHHQDAVVFFQNAIKFLPQNSVRAEKFHGRLLKSLFYIGEEDKFCHQLEVMIDSGQRNALIGSFGCQANLKYNLQLKNPFCNEPMKFILSKSLIEICDFKKLFVKKALSILREETVSRKKQSLVQNGYQTAGNIFATDTYFSKEAKNIIHDEIEKYRDSFIHSEEGIIEHWPKGYYLNGWLVSYQSGGKISPHMHEAGWLSGSIYINVPKTSGKHSGDLVLCIEPELSNGSTEANNKTIIDVDTGGFCLFPSSLLHYTIPFESEEDRIVLAFDVIPNN